MKVICEQCGWHGTTDQLLVGSSPFEDATVYGCPKCKAIDSTKTGCDEPGCMEFGTCGATFNGEYRFTCGKHFRR